MQPPENYAETPEGLLFFADGLTPVKRWDGSAPVIYPVGVAAPTGPVTLASTDLVTGVVTDATDATPIVLTSVAHGLSSGDAVSVQDVLGNDGANGSFTVTVLDADTFALDDSGGTGAYTSGGTWKGGINGTYFAFVRYVNERGSVSDLSPVSAPYLADGARTITFADIPPPAQANVVSMQLLRNTDGQTDTFYVDVETTDLVSTSQSSTKTDAVLSAGTAAPLFDDAGDILANLHGVPPSHKTVLAHHSGRMFLACDRHYQAGGCRASAGDTLVRGVNTRWTAHMAGRQLWVVGATRNYDVLSVDADAQTLELTEPWEDASDDLLSYTIRPAPAERRVVYFTEAGLPESWPVINGISLQEDGDEITGLMTMDSFLYILESRHVYRYTFQSDPAVDGFVYLSGNRGCINSRCWVIADGDAFMLDHQGIHRFNGDDEGKAISDMIAPLFEGGGDPRINWQALEMFHCAHSPDERTIRWFVCLSGEWAPRHAIAYDYRTERFWIEEYDRQITSTAMATLQGRRRVFAAARGSTYVLSEGTLDCLDPVTGRTRGTATAGDRYGLTDDGSYQYWPAASLLVGQSVTLVEGKGAGQRRGIVSVAGPRISLRTPWLVTPDATTVYQLGGVGWEWKSGWLRYTRDEEEQVRRVEVLYRVTPEPASLVLRLYEDFRESPVVMKTTRKARYAEGFGSLKGSADLVADTSGAYGQTQQRIDGHKEINMTGPRYLSVGLSGVLTPAAQAIYEVSIDGVEGAQQ